MKTREEIEKLKMEWRRDPIWDIEDTEGFEDHIDELRAYRLQTEKEWADQGQKDLEEFAAKIGTDNLQLAKYVRDLEYRVLKIEEHTFIPH